MTSRFTVVQADGADEIDATVDEATATVRLSAQAVHRCFGWERKDEGLCRDDVCIPARRLAGIEGDDGWFDLDGLAALLTRPIAIDTKARAAFVGVSAPTRAAPLARFEAPDFTLPDLDGHLHSLSDYRGRKVLLLAWASF
jgi:hypothetical protein